MTEHETPIHVQTVIMPSELKALKAVTNEEQTKDAVSKAILFAIENYKE